MIVQEIIQQLETLAPLAYAEEFDNVGLLVGDKNTKVSGVLVTLDTCLLYTSPSPRDLSTSRMPSSA